MANEQKQINDPFRSCGLLPGGPPLCGALSGIAIPAPQRRRRGNFPCFFLFYQSLIEWYPKIGRTPQNSLPPGCQFPRCPPAFLVGIIISHFTKDVNTTFSTNALPPICAYCLHDPTPKPFWIHTSAKELSQNGTGRRSFPVKKSLSPLAVCHPFEAKMYSSRRSSMVSRQEPIAAASRR